ncbi:hypothetical protein AJ88_15265 [Mesorhizobium amorphae CCBAU 01583]|nr:hypothetical protein AJ88_15265 [Mesorhizobium amorphae CCBAU 01583]
MLIDAPQHRLGILHQILIAKRQHAAVPQPGEIFPGLSVAARPLARDHRQFFLFLQIPIDSLVAWAIDRRVFSPQDLLDDDLFYEIFCVIMKLCHRSNRKRPSQPL